MSASKYKLHNCPANLLCEAPSLVSGAASSVSYSLLSVSEAVSSEGEADSSVSKSATIVGEAGSSGSETQAVSFARDAGTFSLGN